jgi:type II secretory pathway pseudopilin PulG
MKPGYTLLIVLFVLFILALGFMLAVPVWQTQIQREAETELIFRGEQYVEAVRVFQTRFPGRFPKNFEELLEEKCLRRPFRDPMTAEGEWNVILLYPQAQPRAARTSRRRGRRPQTQAQTAAPAAPQKVLIAPEAVIDSIENAQIIGVVSTSTETSKRIYKDQSTYDKWLFYYGQDPEKLPEIVYYGQEEKKR